MNIVLSKLAFYSFSFNKQDFECVEDGKDRGKNVREKARHLSTLLRDEERLHEERTKALLARDRLMHGGLGTTASAGDSPVKYGVPPSGRSSYPIGYSGSNYFEKGTLPSSKCIYVFF